MEIEFLDSTRWIKCQWKYPSHGLYKQQNSSGQVYYLVLFLSSVACHFLILYYQNTDICPSGMCWLFSLIWSVLASSSTNPSKATLTFIYLFFPGSGKPSPYYYSSPTTEEPRRTQVNAVILHKCLVTLHSLPFSSCLVCLLWCGCTEVEVVLLCICRDCLFLCLPVSFVYLCRLFLLLFL